MKGSRCSRSAPSRLTLHAEVILAVVVVAVQLWAVQPTSAGAPGEAWVPTLLVDSTLGLDSVAAFPDGVAYAFHEPFAGPNLFLSKDFGKSWRQRNVRSLGSILELRFASQQRAFALADKGLFRTDDAGSTWSPLNPPISAPDHLFPQGISASTRSSSTVIVGGTSIHPPPAATACEYEDAAPVYTSHDSGVTWNRFDLPSTSTMYRIYVFDDQVAVVISADYPAQTPGTCGNQFAQSLTLWVTHDGGRTFTRSLVCPNSHSCTGASFVDHQRLIVGFTGGGTEISDDGGVSFRTGQTLRTPFGRVPVNQDTFESISFLGPVGYAVIQNAGIWRSTNAGETWTHELSIQDGPDLGSIGDVAAFNADQAVEGGPLAFSIRKKL